MKRRKIHNKIVGIALLCLLVGSTFGNIVLADPKFNIGDTVETTANLNVRTGPGTSYPEITDPDYIGYAPAGTIGTVIDGPSSGDGYVWWKVNYGPGLYTGWSAEDWLEKVSTEPDLTVTSVNAPSSAEPGDYIAVSWTVKNQGDTSSGSFFNRISLATTPYGTDISLGNFIMSSIGVGSSSSDAEIPLIPETVSPGYYYVTVFADAFDGVTESNENNNINKAPDQIHIISNQPPTLYNGYVTPSSGDTSTTFNYYVTYQDEDGDAPTTKYVYIDGSAYTMTKESGSYSSGATFKYSTTLSTGSHNYYFYFNDGHGHTARLPSSGTYSGPSVPPSTQLPQVSTNAASNIGTSSATLNGNLDDTGGETCEVWFEWGPTTSYGHSTTKQSKSTTGSFSRQISGLLSDETYHFRAYASNSIGTVCGSDRSFTTGTSFTDQQKQQEILNIVNSYRGLLPTELVIAIIRQEGGEGAFHVDGWNYNPFYREDDAPWAQPTNGDGVMQVTSASGYHEKSGLYTHDQEGYDHAINDGCDYLLEEYNIYGSFVQSILHYNTGPNSLWIYLGNNWGDRDYLSNIAAHLSDFVPNVYGIQNQGLINVLNQGQNILDDYLYNKGIATGQSVDYYTQYQIQLDNELHNIGHDVVKNLQVPYIHQCWDTPNDFDGRAACGATSVVMVVAYYDKLESWSFTAENPYSHTSDYGNYISKEYTYNGYTFDRGTPDNSDSISYGAYGYIHYPDKYAKADYAVDYLQKYGLNSYVDFTPTEAEVKAQIDIGNPVIASTKLTEEGHWVVIKGYTSDGYYIVNDPYGQKPYTGTICGNYNGKDVLYSWDEMKVGEKYLVMVEGGLEQPSLFITSSLEIIQSSPYYVGDVITGQFTIVNKGTASITFDVLTIGGRDPDDQVADFTHKHDVALYPDESYGYQGTLTLNKVGNYHFFCAYRTPDGNWNTCIDLKEGLSDEDRIEDITVLSNQPPVATAGKDQTVFSGDLVSFDASNSYSPYGKRIVSYHWSFGDGESASGIKVNHRFRGTPISPRTFSVKLTVEDDEGKIATDTASITVEPLEKTIEVFQEQAFVRITASYNWINEINNEDIYIVSKIQCVSYGLLGGYRISILDSSYELTWSDYLLASGISTKTYVSPFTPTIVLGTPCSISRLIFSEGTFEGIKVRAFDAIHVTTAGYYVGLIHGITPPMPSPFFGKDSAYFKPDSIEAPDIPVEPPDLDLANLCSPGELRVYDTQGRITGSVNGEAKEEIPHSVYYNNTILILFPTDSYCYEVAGTEDGSYGLIVGSIRQRENDIVVATDIPISTDEIHQYSVEWDNLSQGSGKVTKQIDSEGDGTFEQTKTMQLPTASIDYSSQDLIDTKKITFDASGSYDLDGKVVSYEWNFGDGKSSSGMVVTNTYSTPGKYMVTLMIIDNDGLTSTYFMEIEVKEGGIPGFELLFFVAAIAIVLLWRRKRD